MPENTLDRDMEEFNELMNEAAKLPAETRKLVAVYTQGVLAMACVTTNAAPEPKKMA